MPKWVWIADELELAAREIDRDDSGEHLERPASESRIPSRIADRVVVTRTGIGSAHELVLLPGRGRDVR